MSLDPTGGPSLTFNGNGYLKYRLLENENKEETKLTLRLRTFASHGTIMYAKGTDYSILEVCVWAGGSLHTPRLNGAWVRCPSSAEPMARQPGS